MASSFQLNNSTELPPVQFWEALTNHRQVDGLVIERLQVRSQSIKVSLPFHLRHENLGQALLHNGGKCLNTELAIFKRKLGGD